MGSWKEAIPVAVCSRANRTVYDPRCPAGSFTNSFHILPLFHGFACVRPFCNMRLRIVI